MEERNVDAILDDIRKGIEIVETKGATPDLLASIDENFHALLELLKLFLISERDTYYGYFLMNMRFEACFYESMVAGIRLNENPPVFAANPLILCKMSLKEIIYVLCHEIEHVLLDHPAQMVLACQGEGEQTYYEFNLAADASVNDRLDAEILTMKKKAFMAAPEGVINSDVLKEMCNLPSIKHLENYAYYFDLVHKKGKKQKPDQPSSPGAEALANNAAGQGNSMKGGSSEEPPEQSDSASQGGGHPNASEDSASQDETQQPITSLNHEKMQDHAWGVDDAEEARTVSKVLVNAAVEAMGEESRGRMPSSFLSEVEKMNRPPQITWERIFKKYVGTIPAGKRKTKARLNRRQPNRFDLMGTVNDKIIKVVVCIDTSGSMSDAMISEVMSEIFAILSKRRKEVTVIECDMDIQDVYVVSSPREIRYKVHGRGGTSFIPAIEYVNSQKYFRDALLVYFTDGYGDTTIPKPLVSRLLWVVFGSKSNLSVRHPYGDVVSFHPEHNNE